MCVSLCCVSHRWKRLKRSPHLVLVLGAAGVVVLQRGELAALGAGLGARVELAQLQEVAILRHVLARQMGNHQPLLQVAPAFRDRTADVGFEYSHLANRR